MELHGKEMYHYQLSGSPLKVVLAPCRMHDFQLHLPKSNDGERGVQTNSFYHCVAPIWNNLPSDVVRAKSVNEFKNALDDFWKDDPSKFNHKYAPPNEDT